MGGVPLVKHLWGIWVASVIAAIAFWMIIWEFDPYTSHWVIFMLLFAGFLGWGAYYFVVHILPETGMGGFFWYVFISPKIRYHR